jgi:hypothetical protein
MANTFLHPEEERIMDESAFSNCSWDGRGNDKGLIWSSAIIM